MEPTESRVVPTDLVEGRFLARPVTADGDKLNLFTDTGGALFVYESVAQRLGLSVQSLKGRAYEALGTGEPERDIAFTSFPVFAPGHGLPPISVDDDPRYPELRGQLLVYPDSRRALLGPYDGVLGQIWFGGRVWTFDYPAGQLVAHTSAHDGLFDPRHTVPVGFPTNTSRRRGSHFPSIEATIDDETHPFLLDTGATVVLGDQALGVLRDGRPSERGGSFVAAWLFEQWLSRHADWRVIEDADLGIGSEPMIEVPRLDIAGHEVGPIWFARRADANFHEGMSRMMDRRVEGALGPPIFEPFSLTVDYPGSRACLTAV